MASSAPSLAQVAARRAALRKYLRSLKIGAGIGLVCGIIVILLGFSDKGLLARSELLSLDIRYRLRPAIPAHPDVALINYDDASLALFGSWPWPRHRQVALVTVMDFYDAAAAGYDVFFSEKNDIVVVERRLKGFIQSIGSSSARPAADQIGRTLRTAIRDYDMEFQKTIGHAENIYLGYFVQEPDKSIAVGGLSRIREAIEEEKKVWTDEKRSAMGALQPYTIDTTPVLEKKIFKMINVVPPLSSLARASHGAGFAQIVKDLDHTVRLYPMFMYYDGRIYPSIGCVMLSRVLGVPMSQWEIRPGDVVKIPGALVPGRTETETIRIPVNENAQLLMNWAGPFNDRFLHVSFRLVSEYYAYYTAKSIARQFAAEPAIFDALHREITQSIDEEVMVTDRESRRIADEVALAHVAAPMIRAGKSPRQILAAWPSAAAVPAADSILQALDIGIQAAAGRPVNAAGLNDRWRGEIEKNVAWFAARQRLADVEPLFFPPPRRVVQEGRTIDFSPVDIEKKVFMIGLTGVGTIDLNPMPYESVSPMVGLHSNALNSILSRQFLKFPVKAWRYPLDLSFALVTAVIGAVTTPFIGFLAVLLMSGAYGGVVCWAFTKYGQWIYWVEPTLAIVLTFVVIVVYHFVEAQREKGKVREIFSAMVSPAVLKLMEENPDRFSLTGMRKPATTFFSAIEKFGKVTSGVAPDELGGILSIYLTPTSEIIMDYAGYIDKYEGHIIMADFGVPLDDPGHAWKCCYAAVEQQQDIESFLFFVKARYGVDVYVTMGINAGYISAGNMGSEKKMQYTVMGDAVNMAARFRPANLIYDTRVIIGEPTVPLVQDHLEIRMLDKLLAKGKTKPTTIFEVQGWQPAAYLKLKQNDPVPPSLLTRWSKCPAEKIFGYQRFWQLREKSFSHPGIPKIREFFESQIPAAESMIKLDGRFEIQKYRDEAQSISAEAGRLLGKSFNGKSHSGKSWDVILDEWIALSRTIVEAIEGGRTLAGQNEVVYEQFESTYSRAATLAGKLQTLKTRLSFHAETESLMERFIVDLHEAVEKTSDAAMPPVSQEQVDAGREGYRKAAEDFYNSLAAAPRDYHEMMSVVGSITEPQRKARQLFVEGVQLHWERRWDESLVKFRAALEILPDDGPSKTYVERVAGYKVDPPGDKWQGEFVQKKK